MIDIEQGLLSSHQPAELRFCHAEHLPTELQELWHHLASGRTRDALVESRQLLRDKAVWPRELLAPLMSASAAAELRNGNPEEAIRLAKYSLSICPEQWMAHAVRIGSYVAMQAGARAFRYGMTLAPSESQISWDEPPSAVDFQVTLASLAWKASAWDEAAIRLQKAFPAGVASMPASLQTDWFRLAFYRDEPSDAAGAAQAMLCTCSIEQLDILLNSMVQHGWTSHALPLYREAFAMHSSNQLLRRRLVGLCIREGQVDEARQLASNGALNILV